MFKTLIFSSLVLPRPNHLSDLYSLLSLILNMLRMAFVHFINKSMQIDHYICSLSITGLLKKGSKSDESGFLLGV